MNRRTFIFMGGALMAVVASKGLAQEPKAPRRIGVLLSSGPNPVHGHLVEEMRSGLKSLGNVEGRDFILDLRWAENRLERLPTLVDEMLSVGSVIIVTHGSAGVAACQQATPTVPIVFATVGDPIGQGVIKSYRHPGGNITGVAFSEEINKKLYEVVKEVLPKASRVATLVNKQNPGQTHHLEDVPQLAKTLGFNSILVPATKEEELTSAFEQAAKAKADAMIVPALAPFGSLYPQIAGLQVKHRIPSFSGLDTFVPAGGLASCA